MDIDEWKTNAADHNGKLTVWVDQESSLKIKKATLEGVCFTMSLDFALKFQEGGTSPYYFVNSIRAATAASKGTNNVPDVYVIKQSLYLAELTASTKRINVVIAQINAAQAAHKDALKQQLTDLRNVLIRNRHGAAKMKAYEKFDADFILNFCDILYQKMDQQVTANGPSYFLVSMVNPGKGGHAVVFSQRPDISCTGFPGVYEYFDANFGLFIFPSKKDLTEFFTNCVWAYYLSKDFADFSLASYIASGNERHNP